MKDEKLQLKNSRKQGTKVRFTVGIVAIMITTSP
jgi:hypothetical protein